jgi:hypothetical protein
MTCGNQLKGEVLMKLIVRALGVAALTAAAAAASASASATATATATFYNTTHADNAYLNWQVSTNTPPGGDGNFADFLTAGPWTTAAACTNVPLTHGATSPVRLDWIANITSCSNSANGGIGGQQWTQFIFRQSFTLTAAEAASLQLTFNWAADDSRQVNATRGSWTPKWSLNSLAAADLKPTIWPGSPLPWLHVRPQPHRPRLGIPG